MTNRRCSWWSSSPVSSILLGSLLSSMVGCASIRPVEQGSLYRSGQLSAGELDRAIGEYGLRTVVNLRGPDPDRKWYRQQQEVCQKRGVKQVDVALGSASPSPQEVETLLATYRDAPRPILIHSWSPEGSVGLASALYRVSVLGDSKEVARRELAPWTTYRWPIPALSGQDRFLRSWSGPDTMLAQADPNGTIDLPDPMFDRVGQADASRSMAQQRGWGSTTDQGPLPPPDMEYFQPSTGRPRAASASPPSLIQPVVWLGEPVGLP
ncbi:hypothetical protein K2X85_14910 [bacterium]|jgi:protein tyrosine phosphatase (PTP) superfamily phosphohydrolase (DUF442 family)|nr:hypothetical protein [bacterium]